MIRLGVTVAILLASGEPGQTPAHPADADRDGQVSKPEWLAYGYPEAGPTSTMTA